MPRQAPRPRARYLLTTQQLLSPAKGLVVVDARVRGLVAPEVAGLITIRACSWPSPLCPLRLAKQ